MNPFNPNQTIEEIEAILRGDLPDASPQQIRNVAVMIQNSFEGLQVADV